MRISSQQIYLRGLQGMQSQQGQVLKLQQQLSSGKKISLPSDDPIAASKINLMKQRISSSERLQANTDASESALKFEESALSNLVLTVQRLRELQVNAGNSALSQENREAIGKEAAELLNQLQGLANTQDSNGFYLFSGSKTGVEAITKDNAGNYIYNGDDTQRYQIVTSGLTVATSDTGSDLFMRIPNGNGRFTISQTATPNVGSAALTTGSVYDESAYVEDDYTLSFTLNTSNQVVVMVTGVNSGSVLPPSGNPDDAPVYQAGAGVNFNGIQLTINGDPQPGDSFSIKPSTNESIFSTVSRMVQNLRQPFDSATERAAVTTENNQILAQLDSALDNLLTFQAGVGARMNQLDVATNINEDVTETSKTILSSLQDTDLADAAVKLNLQIIYLQAAQQSFARIQGLTAFNYLK
ncbi:flagellar hook-associated protein FlgL [Legionella dresdenensis]|uniref:Flagellar hook-associated protein FlgL n=1 Tax=Legionella dresdenensis TaxID=450200 RepID=A0ABV8CCS7_9GAMM